MKDISSLIWLVLAMSIAWAAYNRMQGDQAEECQAYDRLGHGIGCEGWDLTDL